MSGVVETTDGREFVQVDFLIRSGLGLEVSSVDDDASAMEDENSVKYVIITISRDLLLDLIITHVTGQTTSHYI